MLPQFCVHYILILISTLIPLIIGDCITEADKCFDKFKTDLENQMKHQLDNTQSQLNQICHPTDGSFNQFVNCINEVESECHSDKRFRQSLCDKRYFKTRISKFTWKATFFYELCHNTSPELSQGFLENEGCINSVLSTPKWKCDINYERVIKNNRNWKKDLNSICSLWQKYRDCIKRDVNQRCGADASVVSDHVFHSHQSYFEKYYSCNFNSSKFSDECWYDSIKAKATNTQTSISSTFPTNEMTDNNIDSNKSSDLMTNNDNTSPTQNSDSNPSADTLKDTTNSHIEESHDDSWVRTGHNQSEILEEKKSNEMIATDANETLELKANATNESNGKATQLLTAPVSGATTDSKADKYLLIIPLFLVFVIKLLI